MVMAHLPQSLQPSGTSVYKKRPQNQSCGAHLCSVGHPPQHSNQILPDLLLMMPTEKCKQSFTTFCSRWVQIYLSSQNFSHLFVLPTIHVLLHAQTCTSTQGKQERTQDKCRVQPKAWGGRSTASYTCSHFSKDKRTGGTHCAPAPLCTAQRYHYKHTIFLSNNQRNSKAF